MSCLKTFFDVEADVPLEQAIYSATQDKIFGVRGQYVHKFNATSGQLEDSFRFVPDVIFGEASITELGGRLFASVWRAMYDLGAGLRTNCDIFGIDYGLVSSLPLGLDTFAVGSFNGYCNLVTDGTLIYGYTGFSKAFGTTKFFYVDPFNAAASYTQVSPQVSRNDPVIDLIYDSDNLCVWSSDVEGPELDGFCSTTFPNFDSIGNPTPTLPIYGITRRPSNQKIYAVTHSQSLVKFNADEAVVGLPATWNPCTWSILAGILPAGANPIKIKYNPYDGMIYVPNWAADSVSIIDPATDTAVDVITGFDSPIDIVFTPTKTFAVQNSSRGLKEVST